MEYLQYKYVEVKSITRLQNVLNLIINGIPSILCSEGDKSKTPLIVVLNLIINGIPSILKSINVSTGIITVLNLIINGIPSILIYDIK